MREISELNPHNYPTNESIDKNLKILFDRLIELQESIGKELRITSGLRSDEQQQELIISGRTNSLHSKHLCGAAADILDSDGSLTEWCKDNIEYLGKIGFWMEDFESIKNIAENTHSALWVHFQIMPPASGKRVFLP